MAIEANTIVQVLLVYDAAARLRACEAARPLHVSLLRLVTAAAPRLPAATATCLFSTLAPALRAAPDAATPAAAPAAAAPLLCALELLAALAALPALQRQSLTAPLVQVDCLFLHSADAYTHASSYTANTMHTHRSCRRAARSGLSCSWRPSHRGVAWQPSY